MTTLTAGRDSEGPNLCIPDRQPGLPLNRALSGVSPSLRAPAMTSPIGEQVETARLVMSTFLALCQIVATVVLITVIGAPLTAAFRVIHRLESVPRR